MKLYHYFITNILGTSAAFGLTMLFGVKLTPTLIAYGIGGGLIGTAIAMACNGVER